MAIIKWDPFREMITLRDRMNRLFEDSFSGQEKDTDLIGSTWAPSVDIYENGNELILTAELPGMKEDDIEIKVEDNTLTLSGERKMEKDTKEENYHRIERAYGSFRRSFSLPHYIDQESIQAEHDSGVLKIKMNKKPESKPKNIKILKAKPKENKK